MSGQDAQRGFIYQTIVAMIECLDKPDWDAIKLEPETENDKVDISFYANGRMLRAIQVKSSRKAFERADVKNWLDAAVRDAQSEEAEEVWLYLVGGEYKDVCKDYIAELNKTGKNTEPKKHIKTPEFEDVKTYCIGKLCGLHGELITSKEVHWTYHTLLGIVHENSISSRKLSRDEFRAVLSDNIKSASKNGNDLKIAKTVRKLSGNLWINWKTGRLGDSLESALYGGSKDECILDSAGLRLLSVLVQGEGAVVGWDELVRRGIRMNAVMEELRNRSRGEEESPADVGRESDSAEAESADSEKYPSAKEEEEILRKALETAGQYIARGVDLKLEEVGPKVREAVAAVRRLCGKAPALSGIIKPGEKGTGFRIDLKESAIESVGADFPAFRKSYNSDESWRKLDETFYDGYCDADSWLGHHYSEVCRSFEGSISNAGGIMDNESSVFGNYRMAEAYMNAYAEKDASDQSDALLDYVENWYLKNCNVSSESQSYRDAPEKDRVLVLHGQPGDGKTTFCKKAVYAHCFEGWLSSAPNVIRISLNQLDNGGIVKDKKLNLPTLISMRWKTRDKVLSCAPDKINGKQLIILDGYDELAGELAGDEHSGTFSKFYDLVRNFAKKRDWYVVITSRTMCIRLELEEDKEKFGEGRVVSFAPITALQQEMMIDRMIELEKNDTGLRSYQEELPKLRRNKEMKKFLGIPILFRMIVAVRFMNAEETQTSAGLYGRLFARLMDYRGNDRTALLGEYEDIAVRIFNYNNDTCLIDEDIFTDNKKLIYLFLTKSGFDTAKEEENKEPGDAESESCEEIEGKEGQVGFLHGSFRQYFFARYLVSGIQSITEEGGATKLIELLKSLGARKVNEPLVWQFVNELTFLKGKKDDPFFVSSDKKLRLLESINLAKKFLNKDTVYAECLSVGTERKPGSDAEKGCILSAYNAVFNLVSALAAAEKACRKSKAPADSYFNYKNICTLLRSGDYQDSYLENADFSGNNADLSGCNLMRANFNNASLNGTRFSYANLSAANFVKASLKCADFREANLARGNLSDAVLRGAHLEGASLTKADLSGADLTDAYFDWTESGDEEAGSSGEKQTILREANLSGAAMVNTHLNNADFERAILENADLAGASLEGANLTGAKLAGADLTGAKMAGSDLSGADLRGACLIGAVLTGAHMEGAHLADTDLTEAKMAGASLAGADLRGACLIGADLTGAHMEGTCLDRAILKGAILTGAYLERTSLIGAELVGADLTGAHLEGAVLKGAYLDALLPGSNESLSVSPTDNAAKLEGEFLSETDREDKYLLSGADINGAYLSEGQYQYAKAQRALGQPYILTEGGNNLFGGDTQKPSMIAAGMGGIVFGRYKQGKNGEVLPLRWRVLAVEYEEEKPKRALMITEKLIDCRRYHNEWKGITWAECDLKKWLNEVFFFEAFSAKERGKIDLTRNANPPNMECKIDGGKPTKDKVFLLSLGEAEKYFHSNRDRMAEVTKYAITQGSGFDEKGMGWWWIRSPGRVSNRAACVAPGGGVFGDGFRVLNVDVAVRPALWLNL